MRPSRLLALAALTALALQGAHADDDAIEVEENDKKKKESKKVPPPPPAPLVLSEQAAFDKLVVDESWKPYAVLFPSEDDDLAKAIGGVFAELEKKSADMLQFATVDMGTKGGKAIAEAEGWKKGDAGTLIRVYLRPVEGFGKRTAEWLPVSKDTGMKQLYGALTAKLAPAAEVTIVESGMDLQKFIQGKRSVPKVFLFSKKTEPTALYNAMALEFEGRLDLSIIGDKDKDVLKQFNVDKFPSLLVMAGVESAGNGEQRMSIQGYPGKKFQFKPIRAFLSRFAAEAPGSQALLELKSQAQFEKSCGVAPCVLLITDGGEEGKYDAEITKLAKKQAGSVFRLAKIDAAKSPEAAAKLGTKAPSAVMVAALMSSQDDPEPKTILKRNLDEGSEFSFTSVKKFIKETEELVMQTAQSGGASVAEGLEELDSMPAIWGDAKAGGSAKKPRKKSAKAILASSATFNMTGQLFNNVLKESAHVWLLLVCPGGAETGCAAEAAMYEEVSKSLRGLVWCATLDSADTEAPEGASAAKGASLYVYSQSKEKKQDAPRPYSGPMTAEAIQKWALEQLPQTEDTMDSSTFQIFVQKHFGTGGKMPTGVVFYDSTKPGATDVDVAPTLRAFGYQFPSMKFGMMDTKEALKVKGFNFKELIKKQKPPILMLMFLQPQQGPDGQPAKDKDGKPAMGLGVQPYMGKWDLQALSRFLKMHNSNVEGARVLDDVGVDPSIYVGAEVKEITTSLSPQAACGEGARVCAIALLDKLDSFHTKQKDVLDGVALRMMAKAAKGDSSEATPLAWIDAASQGAFMEAFNVASLPTIVVWNPSTGDYGQLMGAFDIDAVFRFVDQATRFSKRKLRSNVKELPAVVEPVAMDAVEEEDFDLSELMGDVMGGGDDVASADDDEEEYNNPNERGPARLKKKKKKKKKSKGKKKKKGKKGKQDL